MCDRKNIHKVKTQATDWQKISARHMKDKGLEPRIHKTTPQVGGKKSKSKRNRKMGQVTQEETQTGNKHMKRCSTSEALQVKTTKYYWLSDWQKWKSLYIIR